MALPCCDILGNFFYLYILFNFLPSFCLFFSTWFRIFFPVFIFFLFAFSTIFFVLVLGFCLFVCLISFFYHLLVVIWEPLNTTFTLTSSKFCISSDYHLWLINSNCLRLPWIYNSVVDSLFFFVNQHSSPSPRLKSFMSYTPT